MTHEINPDRSPRPLDEVSVIDKNPLYDSFIEARNITLGVINDPQCSADQVREELTRLENMWHGYIGEVAKVSGMIRGYDEELSFDTEDENRDADGIGEFAWCLGEDALDLRFTGVDALTDKSGVKHIVYTLADKWADPNDPTYAVVPEQAVYAFETVLPVVRSHILHELEGSLMEEIDARMALPLDDPEGLRGLKIDISPTKYSDHDYDVVQELEAYINSEIDCDRRYPSQLTIDGVVIDENCLLYRTKGAGTIDATYGTFSLMLEKDGTEQPTYRVATTVNVPAAHHHDEDEELTFLLNFLQHEASLRPQLKPIRRLRLAMPEAAAQPIAEPLELEALENPDSGANFEYVARRELIQSTIDRAVAYATSVAETVLTDDESARQLATTCYEKLTEMIGNTLDGVPLVVTGDGVKYSNYLRNGPLQPNDNNNIAFHLDTTLPKPEALLAEPVQVYIIGVDIVIEADDEHQAYQVVPSFRGQLVDGHKRYSLNNPVDGTLAASISTDHFCALQLDGSVEITERDKYGRRQFDAAMKTFKEALAEDSELQEVYDKLLIIASEFRTDPTQYHSLDPKLFQEIGTICGKNEMACDLTNDALSKLFGSQRIARLKGQGHDTRRNSTHTFNSVVRLAPFISTQESLPRLKEPLFAFQVLDDSRLEGAMHIMPLRDVEAIEI